jgi:hypothetical protein
MARVLVFQVDIAVISQTIAHIYAKTLLEELINSWFNHHGPEFLKRLWNETKSIPNLRLELHASSEQQRPNVIT